MFGFGLALQGSCVGSTTRTAQFLFQQVGVAPFKKMLIPFKLNDAPRFQIGWIFGKVPNGLWPPPHHFRKVIFRILRQNCDKSAYVHMEGLLCIIWSYFPWDACSTTVQRGNWLKTYPKKTLCIILLLKKPCLKVQVLQYEFVDWKWPHAPTELFQKIICFGDARHP